MGEKSYFFWLLESRSNPSTDPLVVWLTGGPGTIFKVTLYPRLISVIFGVGCSSQMALLAENGPCWVNKHGNGTILNEHSWTNKANVIWVNHNSFGPFWTKLDQFGLIKTNLDPFYLPIYFL